MGNTMDKNVITLLATLAVAALSFTYLYYTRFIKKKN
ncbi:hypothetical protein P378_07530 [Desulforamulus profundi]|uniref:Uncharacterized protein n=1 Tax=Desulforamulus profundi TaxID=1383067 RepID=A0A2C6MCB9_9FIRM|nr:hypothetical protein P378_07530 [Desulforamulus profundi]